MGVFLVLDKNSFYRTYGLSKGSPKLETAVIHACKLEYQSLAGYKSVAAC